MPVYLKGFKGDQEYNRTRNWYKNHKRGARIPEKGGGQKIVEMVVPYIIFYLVVYPASLYSPHPAFKKIPLKKGAKWVVSREQPSALNLQLVGQPYRLSNS